MIDRRQFLGLSAALPAFGAPARPFDVLFIAVEDLQTCLSSYGNPVCRTPNIDAIARAGIRFDNAQCQFPVCNPTRSSMLSGLRPPTTRVLGNATNWTRHLPLGSTLPEAFSAAGYETVRVGKMFHEGSGDQAYDDAPRWSRIIPEREGIPRSPAKNPPPRILFSHKSEEERRKVYDYRAWVWGPQGRDDLDCNDGAIAEHAVRLLSKKPGDKPLFLALGFHRPHLPLHAPAKYFEMYPPASIPLPQYQENDFDDVPRSYGTREIHRTMTDATRREAIAAYYACLTYVDAGIGRVMAALKSSGRDRNTVVIFWGDHGFHLGEHMLWQKMTLFEESCRVPFIISAPGVTRPAVCRRPVEPVDLFPTLAELCSLKTPANLEGISMVPLLENPGQPWKKGAFTYHNAGKSVRTERWRYTEWGGPANAELYDHETDPREITNLARDPKHAATVAELSRLLKGDWRAALPG